MIDVLRIERTNTAPKGEPPLFKVRLITKDGDVLTPTEEQHEGALLLMSMFDDISEKGG
jgi:hypothetical protein